MSRVSKSVGGECAECGCSNTFYNYHGTPSGLHFFKLSENNPEERILCTEIKQIDGMDGFRVFGATCLCQEHFRDEDTKRSPHCLKLVAGAVPNRLYYLVTPRQSHREPRNRSKSQLSDKMHKNACTSPTSSLSSLSLDGIETSDFGAFSEYDHSLGNENLYQDLIGFRAKGSL